MGGVQLLCVFMAGVRHKSSTLFQPEIARDRRPETLARGHSLVEHALQVNGT